MSTLLPSVVLSLRSANRYYNTIFVYICWKTKHRIDRTFSFSLYTFGSREQKVNRGSRAEQRGQPSYYRLMRCRVIYFLSHCDPSLFSLIWRNIIERSHRKNVTFIKHKYWLIFSTPYSLYAGALSLLKWLIRIPSCWSRFLRMLGFLAGHCQKAEKTDFMIYLGSWRFGRAVSVGQLKERKGRAGQGESRGEWGEGGIPGVC